MIATKSKYSFTKGSILPQLILFALPIIFSNLLQAFYNAADMVVVGMSEVENAVGAIGTTTYIFNLFTNIFIGFSIGANVVVAKYIGAKDPDRVRRGVHTSIVLSIIFGTIGMLVGILTARPILTAMGNRGSLLDLAVTYITICFLGMPFLSLTNFLIAIFRAKGDSKTPLVILGCCGLCNVVFNMFFVLVMGLSVEGVAFATMIANILSSIVLLLLLCRKDDDTKISFKCLKISPEVAKEILYIGIPSGLQGACFSASNMLVQSSVISVNNLMSPSSADFQPIVVGCAAAGSIEGFNYTTLNAVHQATLTFISQNNGAKEYKRLKPIMYRGVLMNVVVGILFSIIILAFKTPLLALYGVHPGEPGSLDALATYAANTKLYFICMPYCIAGIMEVLIGVLRGLGKSVSALIITLTGTCLIRVVWLLLVFPLFNNLGSIFIIYPISWIICITCTYILIRTEIKKLLNKNKTDSITV